MNKTLLASLNELLGQELGRTPWGSPIFRWEWSEDLFWPHAATGRKLKVQKEVAIPLIGGGTETCIQEDLVDEMARARMMRDRNVWVVTKWFSPEDLTLGGTRGHGRGYKEGTKPTEEAMLAFWHRQFPGADFPARGWRIATDATLPRGPHDPAEPNEPDTRYFISRVKAQTALSPEALVMDMLNQMDAKASRDDLDMGSEIRDLFPAFLNPAPGKRGAFVSFPKTRFDR